jgi:hypothetical protein
MTKLCSAITALAGVIVLAFMIYFYNESHDARASDVYVLKAEMRYTFESDILSKKEDRLFKLRIQCDKGYCTEQELYELQQLEEDVKKLRQSVDGWEKQWRQR